MVIKGLIRVSVAALVLVFIGISGCSDNSDRIYSPPTDETNNQLAAGAEEEYFTDGSSGTHDGYPIYDDGEGDDPSSGDNDWLDKYADDGGGTPGGGGSTKPLDFEPKAD